MPESNGIWNEKILYNFNIAQSLFDSSDVILDTAGNLYGTLYSGGDYGAGAEFELIPKPVGDWTEIILHGFNQNDQGSYYPYGSPVID